MSLITLLCITVSAQDLNLQDFLEMSYFSSERINVAKLEQKKRMAVLEERKGDFLPQLKAKTNYAWIPKSASMLSISDDYSFHEIFKATSQHASNSDTLLSYMMDGVISGLSSGTSNHSLSMGLEITQTIWAQGKIRKAYEVARLEGRAAICDWQEAQMNVKAEGTRLFYSTLLAEQFLRIAEKRLKRAQERHQKSVELFGFNMTSQLDTLNTFLGITNATSAVRTSKNSVSNLKKRMKSMAHMEIDEDSINLVGELKPDEFSIPYDLMEEQTLIENKVLTKLSSIKEISEIGVEMAKASYLPTIYSGITLSRVARFGKLADFDLQPDRQVFIGAEIELFSFNRRLARLKQAEYDMRISRQHFEEQEREILLMLKRAYDTFEEHKEGLSNYRVAFESAQIAMGIAEERYDRGQMSLLDLQDQEDLLLESEYALASAIFAHNSALIDLRLIIADYIYEKE